jgi:hypothetical protein
MGVAVCVVRSNWAFPTNFACFFKWKLFSEENPPTTGASAAGICGSFAFAKWLSPFTWYSWICAWKALRNWPTLPENSMTCLPGSAPGYAEPLSGQPCFDRSDVLVRRAELLAELLRRKPLVVVRMAWRVQLAHQLIERRLLAPAPLQHQVNPLQRCAIRCGSAIVLRVCQRMHRASERYHLLLVNRVDDSHCAERRSGRHMRSAREQLLMPPTRPATELLGLKQRNETKNTANQSPNTQHQKNPQRRITGRQQQQGQQ